MASDADKYLTGALAGIGLTLFAEHGSGGVVNLGKSLGNAFADAAGVLYKAVKSIDLSKIKVDLRNPLTDDLGNALRLAVRGGKVVVGVIGRGVKGIWHSLQEADGQEMFAEGVQRGSLFKDGTFNVAGISDEDISKMMNAFSPVSTLPPVTTTDGGITPNIIDGLPVDIMSGTAKNKDITPYIYGITGVVLLLILVLNNTRSKK